MEFPGINEKRSGISKPDQEKIMWNFQRSWTLDLKFPRNLTKICGIPRGKVKKTEKFQRGFQRSMSSTSPSPCVVFFLE